MELTPHPGLILENSLGGSGLLRSTSFSFSHCPLCFAVCALFGCSLPKTCQRRTNYNCLDPLRDTEYLHFCVRFYFSLLQLIISKCSLPKQYISKHTAILTYPWLVSFCAISTPPLLLTDSWASAAVFKEYLSPQWGGGCCLCSATHVEPHDSFGTALQGLCSLTVLSGKYFSAGDHFESSWCWSFERLWKSGRRVYFPLYYTLLVEFKSWVIWNQWYTEFNAYLSLSSSKASSRVRTWEHVVCLLSIPVSTGFDPWVGKIPRRRAWQPTPGFLPGESPWTEEPGGLQSMGLQRIGHDWVTKRTLTSEGVGKENEESLIEVMISWL